MNFHRIRHGGLHLLVICSVLLLLSCTKKSPVLPALNEGTPFTPDSSAPTIAYLALGDSYTIGQSVSSEERYPVQAAAFLNAQGYHLSAPEIIAVTGWTTRNLLDAMNAKNLKNNYGFVTLLIGVNNQYQGRTQSEYRTEFLTLLNKAIALAEGNSNHVIVLSIPDYGVTPYSRNGDRKKIADEIDAFNKINFDITTAANVTYLDITTESRKALTDDSLIAADGLHYSGKEYNIWAELLVSLMKQKLR